MATMHLKPIFIAIFLNHHSLARGRAIYRHEFSNNVMQFLLIRIACVMIIVFVINDCTDDIKLHLKLCYLGPAIL